jgi:flagellar protein FliO/FliZ
MRNAYLYPLLVGISCPAWASEKTIPSSSGGIFQILFVLLIVLGLMIGAAWLLKKFNAAGAPSGGNIKVIGGVAVGNRERIMVVEVADQWIVVGVTSNNINALSTMPRQEIIQQPNMHALTSNFALRLKQFIEKRNVK